MLAGEGNETASDPDYTTCDIIKLAYLAHAAWLWVGYLVISPSLPLLSSSPTPSLSPPNTT